VNGGPVPRARKPAAAPTKADLDERDRYARLTAGSLDAVRGSAQAWRNGLAAFITLVTAGVVLQGRDSTSGLPGSWRAAVTVLVGGGLMLAVAGLWQALAAEAGTSPRSQTLHDIRAAHGTLAAFEVHLAAQSARRLQLARRAVAAAVTLLLAGITATWWAPAPAAGSAPAYLIIAHGNAVTCGTLQPAPPGQLRLTIPGSLGTVTIPITQVTTVTPTTTCP
jgi:hypothetical protein